MSSEILLTSDLASRRQRGPNQGMLNLRPPYSWIFLAIFYAIVGFSEPLRSSKEQRHFLSTTYNPLWFWSVWGHTTSLLLSSALARFPKLDAKPCKVEHLSKSWNTPSFLYLSGKQDTMVAWRLQFKEIVARSINGGLAYHEFEMKYGANEVLSTSEQVQHEQIAPWISKWSLLNTTQILEPGWKTKANHDDTMKLRMQIGVCHTSACLQHFIHGSTYQCGRREYVD